VFSLFPNEGNKELAMRLLTEHVDCVRDEVAHLADEKVHQNCYLEELELALQIMFNKENSKQSKNPSEEKTTVMAHSHCHDDS
jgi:hypothetical protein